MPVNPRYWKQLERHPKSAEYPDIKGKAWEQLVGDLREHGNLGRKITLAVDAEDGDKEKVLDGWQLYRAHCEANIKPEFARPPKGVDLDSFVRIVNDNRRHEDLATMTARAEARRERVAAARQEGKSIRTIAEEENVSPGTVQSDLAASGVQGIQLGDGNGKVTGRDGKQHPATKPPQPLCERCTRVGAVKNCEMCKEERGKAKSSKKAADKAETKGAEPTDAFGTVIPKGLRPAYLDPWIQETYDLLCKTSEAVRTRRLGDGMRKRAKHYPFLHSKDFCDGITFIVKYLDDLTAHLRDNRPAGVCPACDGKRCDKCKMSGLVPRKLREKLSPRKEKAGATS